MISFNIIAIITLAVWLLGLIFFYILGKNKIIQKIGEVFFITGIAISVFYIIRLWVHLERPPMRTLGETRLWYAFFVPATGLIIFYKWKMKWMPVFSIGLSSVFILVNLMHPENFDKSLMPALRSIWFIPHVIVYIFSYALLAVSMLVAIKGLLLFYKNKYDDSILLLADNIVYIGFAFLTFGLLFGALWAKEAWGHYWTWDPKETWAFLTWLLYLLYIHFRYQHKNKIKASLWILGLAFLILLICWFGINYLPAAQKSVHIYGASS